jgi:hypothetical protein
MAVIFQIQAKDAVLRFNHFDAVNCVQRFNWDSAMNEENTTQLGDANYDSQTTTPEVTASMDVRATGALAAFLSRMIYRTNAGTGEFEGHGPVSGVNAALIRETDLERAVFDLIEAKKANEVFDRATLIPRAALRTVAISARTDGSASEAYTFESDLLEIFRAPKHDLISLPVVRDTATTPTTTVEVPAPYDVESHTVIATAEWKIHAMDIDGVRVPAANLDVTTGPPDKVTLGAAALAEGKTIPLGARVVLIMYRKTPGAFPVITYPTTARFVKADKINIWLVSPTAEFTVGAEVDKTVKELLTAGVDFNEIPFTDSDLFLRVQSMEMSVDMRREALREIRKNDRGNPVFYRAATYPLQTTASVQALEGQHLDDWAKMQGKGAGDILDLASFENKEWMIISRYYKGDAALQTVGLLNARVSNPGSSIEVQGRAAISWQFTGSEIAIQGVDGV